MEAYFSPRVDTLRKTLAISSMEEIADALDAQNDTKVEIVWSVAGNLIEARGRAAEQERAAFVAPLFPELAA